MRVFLCILLVGLFGHLHAQLLAEQRDSLLVMRAIGRAKNAPDDMAARVMAVAEGLRGTPYVGGTLDRNAQEQLVINLRQLDCWTFVENCAVIATLTEVPAADAFRTYRAQLQAWRYRDGQIREYGSRLHYFSEWVLRAQAQGHLTDITATLPHAQPYDKAISFMTDNPRLYPKLAADSAQQRVRNAEKWLSAQPRYYVPKKFAATLSSHLQAGDLLIFTSRLPNLDVEHQGFAVQQKGQWHVLHASSVHKRVILSAQPLAAYLARIPAMTGIIVARWKN